MGQSTYYYHYTTRANVKKIEKSKRILPSTNSHSDTSMGAGVYLTRKPPQTSDRRLTLNNYDSSAGVNDPRIQAYVAIRIADLPGVRCVDTLRDVCVLRGEAGIDLSEVPFSIGTRARYGQNRARLREAEDEERGDRERDERGERKQEVRTASRREIAQRRRPARSRR